MFLTAYKKKEDKLVGLFSASPAEPENKKAHL